MNKFLLGLAVGYVLSDQIDQLLGKTAQEVKVASPSTGESTPPDPTTPMTAPQS